MWRESTDTGKGIRIGLSKNPFSDKLKRGLQIGNVL